MVALIAGAVGKAAPGGDGRIREEAPERSQTEKRGAAGEGLQHREGQRRESVQIIP